MPTLKEAAREAIDAYHSWVDKGTPLLDESICDAMDQLEQVLEEAGPPSMTAEVYAAHYLQGRYDMTPLEQAIARRQDQSDPEAEAAAAKLGAVWLEQWIVDRDLNPDDYLHLLASPRDLWCYLDGPEPMLVNRDELLKAAEGLGHG